MIKFSVVISFLIFSLVVSAQEAANLSSSTSNAVPVTTDPKAKPPKLLKSQKALWVAHILRDKTSKKVVSDLKLQIDKLPVYLVPQGDSFRPLVKLKLNYNRPGWNLYLSDKDPIRKTDEKGEHTVYAYLRSRISTIIVTAVGPNREIESETFYMFAPEAREYKMVSLFDSVYFSVGHSFLVYRQSSFGTFVSQALLIGTKYISPEKGYNLGYFADANLTLYTYKSSPVEENPQFFDARAGLSYLVKLTKNPKYRSRVTLGASTINLFSLGSPFGFSGLYSPNFGYRTEFYQSAKNSFAAEFQIAPYDFSDFFSQKTMKLSVDWNKNLGSLRRAQLGFSYANHRFSESSGLVTEKVNADQLNLYFGLSF